MIRLKQKENGRPNHVLSLKYWLKSQTQKDKLTEMDDLELIRVKHQWNMNTHGYEWSQERGQNMDLVHFSIQYFSWIPFALWL